MIKVYYYPEMGRGLCSDKNVQKGDIIETTLVLAIPKDEAKLITDTVLNQYVYDWDKGRVAIALGLGSLFNHSYDANIDYIIDTIHNVIVYKANKNIKKGEQLFIDYGYCPVEADKQYLKTKNENKSKK